MINYIPRRFTIVRDKDLCINCGCCVRQCANECHFSLLKTVKQLFQSQTHA